LRVEGHRSLEETLPGAAETARRQGRRLWQHLRRAGAVLLEARGRQLVLGHRPTEHLEEDQAERVEVVPRVRLRSASLFGGYVVRRPVAIDQWDLRKERGQLLQVRDAERGEE